MTLLALTPLRVEARAARRGTSRARVERTGMGPRRATRAATRLGGEADWVRGVAILGVGGAVDPGIAVGDLVVADEVRGPGGSVVQLRGAGIVARELRRAGLETHVGAVGSFERVVRNGERARHHADGLLAVDTESAWLTNVTTCRPLAVVRAIVDTPTRPLLSPRSVSGGVRALRSVRAAAGALERWAAACGPRTVLLAGPRSFCAGVERAIDVVDRALDRFGGPIFVRRQIVHNTHVVRGLEERGALFVEELDDVPEGAIVVLAAHGVAPEVHAQAADRGLQVIDATCPLVAKVHTEARRFAAQGYEIVLIGHDDHEEVEATRGEAPGQVHVITEPDQVGQLEIRDPQRVAYLTQTTLAVETTQAVIDALRLRFPTIVGPKGDDICYATQNRQDAVRTVAREADVVLVVGSPNSSNANRLAEVAEREGCRAYLLEDHSELDLGWLRSADVVGVTAGASAPEVLVHELVEVLGGLGPVRVEDRMVTTEKVQFALPAEVR